MNTRSTPYLFTALPPAIRSGGWSHPSAAATGAGTNTAYWCTAASPRTVHVRVPGSGVYRPAPEGPLFMRTSFRRTYTFAAAPAAPAATTAMLALGASAASAHGRVDPATTTEGAYSRLTVSVPGESPTVKIDRIEVRLPADNSFTSVAVKPLEGWRTEVITGELPKPVRLTGTTVMKTPRAVIWTTDVWPAIVTAAAPAERARAPHRRPGRILPVTPIQRTEI